VLVANSRVITGTVMITHHTTLSTLGYAQAAGGVATGRKLIEAPALNFNGNLNDDVDSGFKLIPLTEAAVRVCESHCETTAAAGGGKLRSSESPQVRLTSSCF
jgi:hypothetical protein